MAATLGVGGGALAASADAPTVPGSAEDYVFTVARPPTAAVSELDIEGQIVLGQSHIVFTGTCDDGSSLDIRMTLLRIANSFVQFDPVEPIVMAHSASIWVDGRVVGRNSPGER